MPLCMQYMHKTNGASHISAANTEFIEQKCVHGSFTATTDSNTQLYSHNNNNNKRGRIRYDDNNSDNKE